MFVTYSDVGYSSPQYAAKLLLIQLQHAGFQGGLNMVLTGMFGFQGGHAVLQWNLALEQTPRPVTTTQRGSFLLTK